jgi:hypothetical protein
MGYRPDASPGELYRAERLIGFLQKAIGYTLTGATTFGTYVAREETVEANIQ